MDWVGKFGRWLVSFSLLLNLTFLHNRVLSCDIGIFKSADFFKNRPCVYAQKYTHTTKELRRVTHVKLVNTNLGQII